MNGIKQNLFDKMQSVLEQNIIKILILPKAIYKCAYFQLEFQKSIFENRIKSC